MPSTRRLLLALALMLVVLAKGNAQIVEVIDELSWLTDDPNEPVPQHNLRYGYGTEWTSLCDSANGKGEFPIPGFAIDGFDALFYNIEGYIPGDRGNYGYSDVRGIPDSVASGAATRFSMVWEIALNPGVGKPIILTQGNLRRGIDSIRIRSTAAGAGFDHTFRGPGMVTMNRSDIRRLEMTVWFDHGLVTSGVKRTAPVIAHAQTVPNPLRSGERYSVAGVDDPEARYTVRDLMGREVARSIGAPPVLNVGSGFYILDVVESRGAVRQARLIVQ